MVGLNEINCKTGVRAKSSDKQSANVLNTDDNVVIWEIMQKQLSEHNT